MDLIIPSWMIDPSMDESSVIFAQHEHGASKFALFWSVQ